MNAPGESGLFIDLRTEEITNLLKAWGSGDEAALVRITEHIYPELRLMARRFHHGICPQGPSRVQRCPALACRTERARSRQLSGCLGTPPKAATSRHAAAWYFAADVLGLVWSAGPDAGQHGLWAFGEKGTVHHGGPRARSDQADAKWCRHGAGLDTRTRVATTSRWRYSAIPPERSTVTRLDAVADDPPTENANEPGSVTNRITSS